jgi:hypothetical protein
VFYRLALSGSWDTLTNRVQRVRIVADVRHCRLREDGSIGQFVIGVQVHAILEGAATWLAITQPE